MSEQVSSNTLLPCPFCGGKAGIHRSHDADGMLWAGVRCQGCGAASTQYWCSPGNDCPIFYECIRNSWNRRPAHEPPAVDVAPIAKLTVRDGLVQRAGLYAPGLPDGDHDVFPVPLSPKGELRPHVLADVIDITCDEDDERVIESVFVRDDICVKGPSVTKSAVQEYQKASLSICEHPHVDFGRCTYCDAVVGAAVETSARRQCGCRTPGCTGCGEFP